MITIIDALISLQPLAKFSAEGSDYHGVTWLSPDIPMPTEAEAIVELNRLLNETEKNQYQAQRASEYPSFADQFDLLYHGGYDAWKAAIDAVKAKYPKGI